MIQEPGQTCPRPMCPSPAGRGAGSANPQLGSAPPPPQHPWPLLGGSPYLPGGPGVIPSAPRGNSPPLRRRGKRSSDDGNAVSEAASAVGTLDVSTELSALDMDEKVAILPDSLHLGNVDLTGGRVSQFITVLLLWRWLSDMRHKLLSALQSLRNITPNSQIHRNSRHFSPDSHRETFQFSALPLPIQIRHSGSPSLESSDGMCFSIAAFSTFVTIAISALLFSLLAVSFFLWRRK